MPSIRKTSNQNSLGLEKITFFFTIKTSYILLSYFIVCLFFYMFSLGNRNLQNLRQSKQFIVKIPSSKYFLKCIKTNWRVMWEQNQQEPAHIEIYVVVQINWVTTCGAFWKVPAESKDWLKHWLFTCALII